MKVILQKDVANLGDAGEIKEVAAGYARNYLLPKKLVTVAHTNSVSALNHQQEVIRRKTDKRNKEMNDLSGKLGALEELEIQVKVGANNKLFGSVTSQQVSNALKEKGYPVDKRKVEIGDKIRSLGNVKIKIKLAEGIHTSLILKIVPDADSMEALEAMEKEAEELKARAAIEAGEAPAPSTEETSTEETSTEEETPAESTEEETQES